MNLLVLCPLPLELKFLLEHLSEKKIAYTEKQVGPLKVYECKELNWLMAVGGHGKTQFAVHTQFLIHQLEFIEAVICAGCAGGLAPEVKVHDLVIAEKTVEHDFQLRFFKRPDPEFPADKGLIEKLRQAKSQGEEKFSVHFGIVASGDEDIVDKERGQELITQTGAMAVAWEGAGGARACKLNQLPYVEVRGITDGADSNVFHDFEKDLKIVMSNVGNFLIKAFKV